ncbi:MAG: ATP-binding protein [Oculatellaceae cyanobacterium bins.114]|nr:ATP-binding protein [Oculatellaceae cyanobacterium bins.114]
MKQPTQPDAHSTTPDPLSSELDESTLATDKPNSTLLQAQFDRLQPRWRSRSFIGLLLFVGVTAIVAVTAFTSYKVVHLLLLKNLKQQALSDVQQGRSELDAWISTRKAEVVALANTPTVRSLDWAVTEPYLHTEIDRISQFHLFVVARPDGSFANTVVGRAHATVSDREWFQRGMAGETWVSSPLVGRTAKVTLINVVTPITQPGHAQPVGVFAGAITINRLVRIVKQLDAGPGSYAFALDANGVPIAHPDSRLIGTPERPAPSFLDSENADLAAIAHRMVDLNEGIDLVYLDGRWQYVAYAPLKQVDWAIALVIPRENIESQLGALNLLASVLGGLIVIALIGVWRQLQLLEQTRTRAAQEALLNRLTNRIRASLDLRVIVQTTITELATLLKLKRVLFGWYDPQTQQFELASMFPQKAFVEGTRFQPSIDLDLPQALQDGKFVCLVPVGFTPETKPFGFLKLQARTYLSIAIPTQEERSGYLIGLDSHPLSRDDQELLNVVADQLAIAITQSHLYSQTQAQVQLLNETLETLKKTQLRLIQSEKMSSLGQLIAGIAHEINNPVNFIYGNLAHANQYIQELLELIELYQLHYPRSPQDIQDKTEFIDLEFIRDDLPKLLASIQVGAQRIREIVKSLRIFSRLDEAEVKGVDIHESIDSALMILQNRFKPRPHFPGIQVVKDYGRLPPVECYAGQLNQVFMNILSNAIDALEEFHLKNTHPHFDHPATITINTRLTQDQEGIEQIMICIEDNGPGISEAVQKRLFDPFFTTKPVGKGTGLGLAISYQIVTERHNGELHCHSIVGQGTKFLIQIPVRQSKV